MFQKEIFELITKKTKATKLSYSRNQRNLIGQEQPVPKKSWEQKYENNQEKQGNDYDGRRPLITAVPEPNNGAPSQTKFF